MIKKNKKSELCFFQTTQVVAKACFPSLPTHIKMTMKLLANIPSYVGEDSTDSFKGGERGRNQYCSDRHHGEVTKFKTWARDQYFKPMSMREASKVPLHSPDEKGILYYT